MQPNDLSNIVCEYLPYELSNIILEYLPCVIIDNVPKLECIISLDDLRNATTVSFYKEFKL